MNEMQKRFLEANKKLAEHAKKSKDVKVPLAFLTALKDRGQDGKPILRKRKG